MLASPPHAALRRREPPSSGAVAPARPADPEAQPSWEVFIVEDHPVVREAYLGLLEQVPDVDVIGTAASAEEALEALADVEPDLVIVDISLPGMSGLDFIAELRARNSPLRALVVSGHDRAVYGGRAREVGAVGYVVKADGPQAFLDGLGRALREEG